MSVKEVTAKAIICDECEKPQAQRSKASSITVQGTKGVRVTVTLTWPAENDVCDSCQVKALGNAARQVGAIKPRGRVAQKAKAEEPPSEGALGDPTAPPPPTPNPVETPMPPAPVPPTSPKARSGRKPRRKEHAAAPVTPLASFQRGDVAMPLEEGMASGPYRVEGTGEDAGRPYVTVLLPHGTRATFFAALLRHATTDDAVGR